MLIKTRVLLNIFEEELEEGKVKIIDTEESEADRIIKGLSHEEYYEDNPIEENNIISREYKDCIISTDTRTLLVKKGNKIIYLHLDDGMSFEENDLDEFSYRFYNGEIIE